MCCITQLEHVQSAGKPLQAHETAGNEFGETDPQEVGKEIAKNTPDVDLTANPKELGEQAGDAVKDAGKEVAKQSPINFITMLDLPSPQVGASTLSIISIAAARWQ